MPSVMMSVILQQDDNILMLSWSTISAWKQEIRQEIHVYSLFFIKYVAIVVYILSTFWGRILHQSVLLIGDFSHVILVCLCTLWHKQRWTMHCHFL